MTDPEPLRHLPSPNPLLESGAEGIVVGQAEFGGQGECAGPDLVGRVGLAGAVMAVPEADQAGRLAVALPVAWNSWAACRYRSTAC